MTEAYLHEYNHERLHSALDYLTPSDYLKEEDHIKHRLEVRKTILDQAREDRPQKQIQLCQAARSA
ncbi:MAG: integrase core domain-containing protein [Leptospirales bacterium]